MTRQSLAAYWLPTVGIGPPDAPTDVHVPLTDVLNYRRADGTPQVDIVNLWGCKFNTAENFAQGLYLAFDPILMDALTGGAVKQLQAAGIKVVLTIVGSGSFGWGKIPEQQRPAFVSYLNQKILAASGYGLDGIDVDDEYPPGGRLIAPVVKAMRTAFPAGKILSKALYDDTDYISDIASLLSYGGIMTYGNDAGELERQFATYVSKGLAPEKLMIGVNAGPVAQEGKGFTSIATAAQVAAWQPGSGRKMGVMVWSFSQDIQQFTAFPQNQREMKFPNAEDHTWQRVMDIVMDACAGS